MYNRNLCNGIELQAGVNVASVFVEHTGLSLE
jgi:hypothetical protein